MRHKIKRIHIVALELLPVHLEFTESVPMQFLLFCFAAFGLGGLDLQLEPLARQRTLLATKRKAPEFPSYAEKTLNHQKEKQHGSEPPAELRRETLINRLHPRLQSAFNNLHNSAVLCKHLIFRKSVIL